jgi:PQQ-dependent dehydrogenase (methanol/ethanol family)
VVTTIAGAAIAVAVAAATGAFAAGGTTDWSGFGNTPANVFHSPLTQVDTGNVSKLGRLFTVDFRKSYGVKAGQQSFVVAKGGTLYVTTSDGNVFAVNGANGDVIWRWKPANTALFLNFGIVANRGVAVCDGRVFVMTVDMTIHALDPKNGNELQSMPVAKYVTGASPNYGYSETSAPICADHRLILGAAGSEYGVRGFVMAFDTKTLRPAWPGPFWTVPPAGTEWRKGSRIAGGGVVWTPTTVDTSTNTLYFGTGSATPLYYPELRPGQNPRADSLIAVDLNTGRLKWWQQQMAFNEWSYDTAQPPQVFDGKIGGKTRRVVSVATMEGVWFLYDAKTGQPIYQRVKVIDRVEHPRLQPGKPVQVYPSSLGGVNYSPASYDPKTNYVLESASETASIETQVRLSPTEKKRKRLLGDVFLGLTTNFGTQPPGWHDYGSVSAIDVATGRQVWKVKTPEPGRGGVTTTDGGVAFAGGGDGVLRAFDTKTGKLLWSFQTGAQIASGVSVYSVGGKEYVATTVGGTPTSSNGGLVASQLQVFGLGGSTQQSPAPRTTQSVRHAAAPAVVALPAAAHVEHAGQARVRTAAGTAHVVAPGALVVRPWDANSSNWQDAQGQLLVGSAPVAGARVSVDDYVLPGATGNDGRFTYPADVTVAGRHVVRVVDASRATVGGKALSAGVRDALGRVEGGISVGYGITGLKATRQGNGILVTGRVADTKGTPPPPAGLYTYELTGTVTDASGKPVQGAVVVTRTTDRDFWTFSSATDANGHYTSFFPASDEQGSDPVPMSVQVAIGGTSYAFPFGVNVNFPRLKSARMDLTLPTGGGKFQVPTPTAIPGAYYQGLVVGASGPGGVAKPLAVHWPDAKGNFSILLPRSLSGKRISLWENQRFAYEPTPAVPGGPVSLATWPKALSPKVATGIASLTLP